MEAATANTGFFQQLPQLKNQFLHDPSIKRVWKLFVPRDVAKTVETEIAQFADEVLEPHIFDWVTDAEKNQPYIAGVQYLRELIFEPSGANVGCPVAMADGAARVLQTHLRDPNLDAERRKVFQNAYDHLVSRDVRKGWTSGQWMTERIGGSDVSLSETVATYSPLPADAPLCDPEEGIPLGPWSIDGFKWFSSATDSNMTMLLAQTPKGLSAFYAPMRRHNPSLVTNATGRAGGTELNGVTISRLKNKMGTKPLPTAELELKGMRGWLVGKEGEGIKQIATILTITRVRSAVSAVASLSRGLSIARAYAQVREVGAGRGRRMKLVDSPLHMRTLADLVVEQHAMMLLSFYSAYLLGMEEHPSSPRATGAVADITPRQELVTPLLRVLTPLLKAYVTKKCIPLIYACMESLGGVGYLENAESEYLNIARIFRDVCVLNIWEGTTDVLGTDLIRALKHPKGGADSVRALDELFQGQQNKNPESEPARRQWETLKVQLEEGTQDELVPQARDVMWTLAEALMAILFIKDVKSDEGPVVHEMCQRYLGSRGLSARATGSRKNLASLELNRAIVYGTGYTDSTAKL